MEISHQQPQSAVQFRAVPRFSPPAVQATESHICNCDMPKQESGISLAAQGAAMITAPLSDLFDRLFDDGISGPELVDQTFQTVMHGNRAEAFSAMNDFEDQIKNLNRNELIETQQHIVQKMARQRNPESFQVLMKMHEMVSDELKPGSWFRPEFLLA